MPGNVGGTIAILCDGDYRSTLKRLRVKMPQLTLAEAEEWWNEQEQQQTDETDD